MKSGHFTNQGSEVPLAYEEDYSLCYANSSKNIDAMNNVRAKNNNSSFNGPSGGRNTLKSMRPTSSGSHTLLHEEPISR